MIDLKVLLVDDNPLVSRVWASQLITDGFQVLTSGESCEALQMLERERPQLMLVDSALPDTDGLDLCERVAATRGAGKAPQIVLLTHVNSADMLARVATGVIADIWIKHELFPREFCQRLRELVGSVGPDSGVRGQLSVGEALVMAGVITDRDLQRADDLRHRENLELDEALLRLQLLPAHDICLLRELVYKADYVDLSVYKVEEPALALIGQDMALRYKTMPLRVAEDELEVVMADPRDVEAIDFLSRSCGRKLRPYYAPLQEVQKAQLLHYGGHDMRRAKPTLEPRPNEEALMDDQTVHQLLAERPVVEMLDVALMKAHEMGASDIHIEPGEDALCVRLRIDGMLCEMYRLEPEHARAVISRVKIMANLNIAECRLPQDGRFQTKFSDGMVDYRVSTMPLADGEKVVIRLQERLIGLSSLAALGFEPQQLDCYTKLVRQPHGMVLLSGPTGSGKSTTLFATLNMLKDPRLNIVSIEDPVEMRIPGVNQIPINPRIGLSFASVLRNVLRQDPNIIMVGEIRDIETGELAVQAALTGHLVLGTLHTNDAPTGFVRLLDMGIAPYMVTSTLHGMVGQRLMRRVCGECKELYDYSQDGGARALPAPLQGKSLYRGRGCKSCRQTGYRGRIAIYEVMPTNRRVKQMVMQKCSAEELMTQARANGMRTLRESATSKVERGESTLEELWRVTMDAEE